MNPKTIKRFWSKVNKKGKCWLWIASKRNKGYGAFVYPSITGDIVQGRAHRFSWELHNGLIPQGICVLHRCDTPACVNPAHLFLGTKSDNNKDMCLKGRHKSGGAKTPLQNCKYKRSKEHHAYKIPIEKIENIKKDRLSGISYGNLVKKYKVSIGYIFRLCHGMGRIYG